MDNNNPLVSVVVTTYNREKLLHKTIISILNQTYKNIELIVVDNYSNYIFPDFIQSFNDIRIKAFQNQNNGIIAVNRNFGIKKAKGEFVAFCDDDDLWMPNKLEEQIKHIQNRDVIGVGSSIVMIGDKKDYLVKHYKSDIFLDAEKILLYRNVALSSLLVKNCGFYFNEAKWLISVEDLEFQLRITCETSKNIILLSKPLIYYRHHATNRSSVVQQVKKNLYVSFTYRNKVSKSTLYYNFSKLYLRLCFLSLLANKIDYKKHILSSLYYTKNKKNRHLYIWLIYVLLTVSKKTTIIMYKIYTSLKKLI